MHKLFLSTHSYLKLDILELCTDIFFKISLPTSSFMLKLYNVHIIVLFAYLLSSYSKFEWAKNEVVQAGTSGKIICSTAKWFL